MGRETAYKMSLEYFALPSREQHLDRDGALCCGKSGVVIGRDPDCHLQIDLPYVSWRHAVVSCLGKSFFLEDSESKDGTLVNSQQLDSSRKYQLLDGDIISIGDQLIEVSTPAWADLLDLDEVDPTDECVCRFSVSTAQNPVLPEEESERFTTTVEHGSPPPPVDQPVVSGRTDDWPVEFASDGELLISSFLAGMELDPDDLKLQSAAYREFLGEMGRTLLLAVDGVRKALYTHDSFRTQYDIPGTIWSRSQLNPMYNTKIDTREVIKILLTSRSEAIAGPVEAIREATGDFYLHGIAVPTAVDEAIRTILETFDWRVLEKDFESSPGFAGFGPLKKARFWELYCLDFDRQVKTLDEFDNSFRRAVAKAYSRAREREPVNGSTEENPHAE